MEKIPEIKYSHEKFDELKKKLEDFYDSISVEDQDDLTMERMGRGAYLMSKYPDSRNYAFYHILIGSSIGDESSIEYEDFPGEDSVELYIDNLGSSE